MTDQRERTDLQTETPPDGAEPLRPDGTVAPPDSPKLNPSDAEADSDLSRPARAAQFRTQRRSHISTAVPALLLIALGVLYLINQIAPEAVSMTRPISIGVAVAAFGLSLVLRFLLNGRRERGLFFIGLLALVWIGLAAAFLAGVLILHQGWPLTISAIGGAMLGTYFFERGRDRGLLIPALIVILSGALALPFTMGMIPADILALVALYWPVVLIILAMALLPRAIRERTR